MPFLYGSLPEFVEAVIAPLYAKHGTSGGGWCASWWAHEEARVRLGAIWRAWETLRLDPSIGIARWLRDVADPQMDRLRDPDRGPFTACGDRHLLPDPLPLQQPPADSWEERSDKTPKHHSASRPDKETNVSRSNLRTWASVTRGGRHPECLLHSAWIHR